MTTTTRDEAPEQPAAPPQSAQGDDGAPAPASAPAPAPAGDGGATAAFAGRVLESLLGAMDLYAIHLGDALGLYAALHADGPLTSGELAARTGVAERYAREWLEQQAVTMRLRDLLARLDRALPELAGHLRSSLRTGRECAYAPLEPVRWRVSR